MSDEQEEALPTALEVKEKVSIGAEFELTDYFKDEVVKGDELVRRKDVEQLIQQKISGLMGDRWTKEGVDALLEELLEELEQ